MCWSERFSCWSEGWNFGVELRGFLCWSEGCDELRGFRCWTEGFWVLKRCGPGVELMCWTERYSVEWLSHTEEFWLIYSEKEAWEKLSDESFIAKPISAFSSTTHREPFTNFEEKILNKNSPREKKNEKIRGKYSRLRDMKYGRCR